MFFHNGNCRSDSDEDRAFIALNISMTTRIESETVDAVRVGTEEAEKIAQSTPSNNGLTGEHLWKLRRWEKLSCGP
jgi:hypothetical protein